MSPLATLRPRQLSDLEAGLRDAQDIVRHLASDSGWTLTAAVPGARGAVCGDVAAKLRGLPVLAQPFASPDHPACVLAVLDLSAPDVWARPLFVDRSRGGLVLLDQGLDGRAHRVGVLTPDGLGVDLGHAAGFAAALSAWAHEVYSTSAARVLHRSRWR